MFSDLLTTEKELWKKEWSEEETEIKRKQDEFLYKKFSPRYLQSKRFADKYKQLFLDNN